MQFRTQIKLPLKELSITHKNFLLVMGSCFAEHIGEWLGNCKFSCDVNPYGVLYNPMSLLKALEEMESGRVYGPEDVFKYGTLWSSWMHHSSFSSPDREEILARINATNTRMQENLSRLQWLVMTWGTNRAYFLKKEPRDIFQETSSLKNKIPVECRGNAGLLVGNCHKIPQEYFEERQLGIEEIVAAYSAWLEKHPAVKLLFTVSPIRYKKYGFHESNLCKAALLLAQDELCRRFEGRCFYFPAYELLMDELRDYRFYAEDMVHPSNIAVEYVKECFSECYFSSDTQAVNHECEGIAKAMKHRPLHPESDVYQCFLRKIVLRIQAITEKYPYLSSKFENELKLCRTQLKQ